MYITRILTLYIDGLYLRDIAHILQLRPSLDYLDRKDEKEKQASQKAAFDEMVEADMIHTEEDAKLVHVSILNKKKVFL